MWSNSKDSNGGFWGSSSMSLGTTWTMNVQTEENGDEIETMQDGSVTVASLDEEEESVANRKSSAEPVSQQKQVHRFPSSGQDAIPSTSTCDYVDGTWVCHPYKIELLERQLFSNTPGIARRTAIIETLRSLGVKVYVIDSESTANAEEVLLHVKRVVGYVAAETITASDDQSSNSKSEPFIMSGGNFQRCLLYLDEQGRLFNLMLSNHSVGPAGTWLEYLSSFSSMEAIIAIMVLCRSLPCLASENALQNLKPAYLALILGLALTEEMSLSWLNASMMIRATPSMSAHSLFSPIGSDTFRRLVLLILTLAGITQGTLQSVLTYGGILGACIILLANLGARAWYFQNWKPMQYHGRGSFVMAFVYAVVAGIIFPFMGHRLIRTGGKGAMEYVLKTAFFVAVAFVISDYDAFQKFLVVGSESELCNQDPVNLSIGIWWTVTLLLSIVLVRRIPYRDQRPRIGERLLVEDQASPVGYKVPSLPDYEIDPTLANTGSPCLSLPFEVCLGVVLAATVGTWLIGLAFTMWDEDIYAEIEEETSP